MIILVYIAAIVILVAIFAALATDLYYDIRRDSRASTSERPAFLDRCLDVPEETIRSIEAGLTITGGGSLDHLTAQAVRSDDFEQVFFIAAIIRGAGMAETIGVWATNDLEPFAGLIFAVNGAAVEFSDWADGGKTDAQFSLTNDGADQATDCTRYKLAN